MKTYLIALVLLIPAAHGAPVDAARRAAHMAGECRSVMERGVCIVLNRRPLPEAQRRVPMRLGFGLGTVPTGAYIDVQLAGTAMCDLIEQACGADWDGERCRVVRSLWRQE